MQYGPDKKYCRRVSGVIVERITNNKNKKNKTSINYYANCLLVVLKRYFKTGEELCLEPTYFCTPCFEGNTHKSKYQLYPVVPSYYAFALYALLSALQSVSLLSSVILAYLPITVAAEDNMAPLAWEKWPMCHHLIFAATAIATIITVIIVTAKIQEKRRKNSNTAFAKTIKQNLHYKKYLWFCTPPARHHLLILDLL